MVRCDRLLKTLFLLVWGIVLLHAYAEYRYLYWVYRWLDIPMHFLGGVWIGLVALWLVYCSGWRPFEKYAPRSPFLVALFGGCLFGFVWEGYDFFLWSISEAGFPAQYLSDTIMDLVMDVCGAVAGYFIYRRWFGVSRVCKT